MDNCKDDNTIAPIWSSMTFTPNPGTLEYSESQPTHQVWPFLAKEVNGRFQAPLVDADDTS